MPRFFDLDVIDIQKNTRDAVVLTLAPPKDADFSFVQGQYLTFKRVFEGIELRRSYSICSAPHEGVLQVAIKRVAQGAFSTWANEALQIGDRLSAMPPMGNFHISLDKDSRKNHLAFALGSGITPIISTLKTILHQEPNAHFTLVYANRSLGSIMFRQKLEELKNTYINRLNIIHILKNDAQNIELFSGRLDSKKCDLLFKHWLVVKNFDTAFICGPEPMTNTVRTALVSHGMAKEKIKTELFSSTQQGRAKQRLAKHDLAKAAATSATITLEGATRSIKIPEGQSLLEAGLANDLDIPFACKAGVCATCRCKVLKGQVDMLANHALEDYEVEKGYILSCQSYALSDELIVDYDQ